MIFFKKKWKYLNTVLDSDTGQGIEFGNTVIDVSKSGRRWRQRRRLCRASFYSVVIVIIPIAIDVFSPIFPFHRKLWILHRFNIPNPSFCWSVMDDGVMRFCVSQPSLSYFPQFKSNDIFYLFFPGVINN